jgi:precorrin-2 dehydrogenase / sirohydrochlorin ferrochelatase
MTAYPLFPLFLKLESRRCLVVGAGAVAESKIQGLLACGAAVNVVAPEATPAVLRWSQAGHISWRRHRFRARDLDGVFLVVVATSAHDLNERVYQEACRRGVLCNVVDDPGHCDFYYPAVVRRGELQIAISTNGRSPALAQRLRRELERKFGPEYEPWLGHLGQARDALFMHAIHPERRRKLLHRLASGQAFRQFVRTRGQRRRTRRTNGIA